MKPETYATGAAGAIPQLSPETLDAIAAVTRAPRRAASRFRQWQVTSDGLCSLRGGYHIDADRLAERRDDRSNWILHMVGKKWVDIEDFIAAWLAACRDHDVDISNIDVVGSVAEARWARRHSAAFHAEFTRMYGDKKLMFTAEELCAVDISEWEAANPRP